MSRTHLLYIHLCLASMMQLATNNFFLNYSLSQHVVCAWFTVVGSFLLHSISVLYHLWDLVWCYTLPLWPVITSHNWLSMVTKILNSCIPVTVTIYNQSVVMSGYGYFWSGSVTVTVILWSRNITCKHYSSKWWSPNASKSIPFHDIELDSLSSPRSLSAASRQSARNSAIISLSLCNLDWPEVDNAPELLFDCDDWSCFFNLELGDRPEVDDRPGLAGNLLLR